MVLNLWKISSKKVQRSITTKTEEIELLKICESAYMNDNAWRDDRLPQNLEVSIGKWYIVVRTPLASIPREVVEWARVHLSCLSHSFRPDYIRVSTRVYVYTSAFAFTYWKNRFMHEFPSNWSYVFYCSPWAVRLSMHVTNSFCNLLLWKRFGCCYNRCMIFWLGNSEQIVRGIVSQYRQIVAISSINENFS